MTDLDARVHRRRSIRLPEWDYSWPWWYFVTICSFDRICPFGNVRGGEMVLSDVGRIVNEEWLKTPRIRPNVELDAYQIMPNHFHGIIIINEQIVGATRRVAHDGMNKPDGAVGATFQVAPTRTLVSGSLGAIIGQFKSVTAKRVNVLLRTRGFHLWQRSYYDHIIRNDVDLQRIRRYIRMNPLRWAIDRGKPGEYSNYGL